MPGVRFHCLIQQMHQFDALQGRKLAIASGIFRGTVDSVAFPNTVACQSGSPVTGMSIFATHRRRMDERRHHALPVADRKR